MLQNNTCFCIDSSPGNQASLPCNLKCPGNEAEDCGDADVISVYRKGTNCRNCELFFQIPHIRLKFCENNFYVIQSFIFTSPQHGKSFEQKFKKIGQMFREQALIYLYLIHKKIHNQLQRENAFFDVSFCCNNYTKYCCFLNVQLYIVLVMPIASITPDNAQCPQQEMCLCSQLDCLPSGVSFSSRPCATDLHGACGNYYFFTCMNYNERRLYLFSHN